jgi:hypothetical protein
MNRKILARKTKGRGPLGELDVEGRIALKQILRHTV